MASATARTAGEESSPAVLHATDQHKPPNAEVLPIVAAQLLFVHRRTIVRMFDRGELTGRRTRGGHRRISLASVHARIAPKAGDAS